MGNSHKAIVLALMFLVPTLFAGFFASGQVQAAVIPLPNTGWQKGTLDSVGVGEWPSMAIDAKGNLHISYYDFDNSDLKYISDATGMWNAVVIDSSGNVGRFSSIGVDSNGKVHISYYDSSNHALKYATDAGESWTTTTIDRSSIVGEFTSIGIDSHNKVHISYYDIDARSLKYASNAAGTWTNTTVDDPSAAEVGEYTSLALDSNDKVHITYLDTTNNNLKYATNVAGTWQMMAVASGDGPAGVSDMIVDSQGVPRLVYVIQSDNVLQFASKVGGSWTVAPMTGNPTAEYSGSISMVQDHDGMLHVTYMNHVGQVLMQAVNGSSTWYFSTIDASAGMGLYSSVAVDLNSKVYVAYFNSGGKLEFATDSGASWYVQTADSASSTGTLNSIVIDSQNNIHIAYKSSGPDRLMYAKRTATGWVNQVADGSREPSGDGISLAVDLEGRAHITYYDLAANSLRYATNTGGTWTSSIVAGGEATQSSVMIDSNGRVHILFVDSSAHNLMYTNNTAGGSWQTVVVDSSGQVSGGPSALIDDNDVLHAIYFKSDSVVYVTNEGGSWHTSDIDTESTPSGKGISLAQDSKGHLYAVYFVPFGGYLIYNTNASGSWSREVIEGLGFIGSWCSVGVGPDDVPRLAYHLNSFPGTVMYLTKPKGVWMKQVIGTSDVGSYGQMALNAYGRPVVCYYDYVSENPKIAEHVTLPSQVTEVAAVRGNGIVEITWSSPEEKGGSMITAYRIYKGLGPSNLSMVASVSGDTFTYLDIGLTNGVRVYYSVSAVNVEGQGTGSTVVSAVPATFPSAPRELKATAGSASVQLSWLAPTSDGGSPITHYRVWRGSNATVLGFLGNTTGTSFTDGSAENGKTYYYHVTAVNDVGEGVNSTTISASPKADDTLLLVGIVAIVVLAAAVAIYVFMRRR